METFAKNDYYVQLFFLISGVCSAIFLFPVGGFLFFYFIVGIPQLISFLIKLFLKTYKSPIYIFYGILILPVWISFATIIWLKSANGVNDFLGYIMVAAFFYSPLLAVAYVYDNYKIYQSLNNTSHENA